jgi:FKBP-type peptidyl-prolyl cis-trans isomerase FkpA
MKSFFISGAVIAAVFLSGPLLATELETEAQKLGYIIGMDIGASLKQQGTDLDLDTLIEAIRATYNNETLAMTPEEAASVRETFINERRAEADQQRESMASINAAEGDKFLLENGVKEGVKVTDSGLQYKVVVMGDGAKPAASDKVTVHYRGTLLNGEEFDSSYSRNQPTSFQLDQVIPGWTEGVALMPVGSKFMFYIPPDLGYGANGGGPIGPNAPLIFEVELLSID